MRPLACAGILAALLAGMGTAFSGEATKPPMEIALTTQDKWNTFTRDEILDKKAPFEIAVQLKNNTRAAQNVRYLFLVKDYWGAELYRSPIRKLMVPAGGTLPLKEQYLPNKLGAFEINARVSCSGQLLSKTITAIIVPQPHEGLRPESFFASNTSLRNPEFQSKLGLKVYRQHFAAENGATNGREKLQPGDPVKLDFSRLDKYVEECKKYGMSIVGIVGYASYEWGRSPEAVRLKMYGPPRDYDEFLRCTLPIVERYKDVKYWEFWNEPWIYGWTWAGSSAEYRQLQKMWLEAARKVRPDAIMIAGHSGSFLADNISPDPACYKGLVDADSNHPYKEGEQPTWRRGSQLRYTDYGIQEARRMGINLHFITENGTEVPGEKDHPLNAPKIVALHVLAALAGEYQMNIQEGIGWGTDQLKGSAAYAVMTHFLEDRVPVADIWPSHPLIHGAIFANRALADSSLPRAKEFSARWSVAGQQRDVTKVAVVWSYTGQEEKRLDDHATLTLTPARDIEAFDIMGNPVGTKFQNTLTIPFGLHPIYLTSDLFTVKQLYELIRDARIREATPVNLSLFSLTKPVEQHPEIVVRVQNQLNRPLTARLSLGLPKGWAVQEKEQRVSLKPAELNEVAFHLTKAVANANNLYSITAHAASDAGNTRRTQAVQAAYAPKKTITVDGSLSDWQGVSPVTIDSDWLGTSENWTQRALNPNLPRPAAVAGKPRVVAKAYTAWDDKNVYLAFAVKEPSLKQDAGKPYKDTRYTSGDLGGLGFPLYSGDAVEFVFGINERAQDDYRQPDDPWYWKGCFRDTDYQYLTYSSANGPQFVRLHKPGIPYRDGFQTEVPTGQGPVEGARVKITREGELTVYELSLPRTELALLNPEKQGQIRYGFLLSNDEGVGAAGRLQWSQAAGVFDYWFNNASYQPSWESFWAAQTRWGLGK